MLQKKPNQSVVTKLPVRNCGETRLLMFCYTCWIDKSAAFAGLVLTLPELLAAEPDVAIRMDTSISHLYSYFTIGATAIGCDVLAWSQL